MTVLPNLRALSPRQTCRARLLALALLLSGAAQAQQAASPDVPPGGAAQAALLAGATPAPEWSTRDVDALVAPLLEDGWVMGLVVVLADGERTEVLGYGRRSAEDPRPPDAESIFEIGSVTKVFTGLLLAEAVRRGELTEDTPVATLLPEEAVVAPRRDELAITLLDLATHTSGLPRLPPDLAPADWEDPYADYGEAQLHRTLAALSLTRKPDTPYAYSNLGVGLLGHVLARAAGKDYESLVQRRIAKPLHLGATRIQLDDERHARFVQGHDADLRPVPPWNLDALAGAGALRSSARDLLAFGRAHLPREDGGAAGDVPDVRSPGVPRDATAGARDDVRQDASTDLDALRTAAAMAMVPRRPSDTDGYMLGLGWHVDMAEGAWLHTGQTGGYAASLSVVPDRGQVVVVLTNTATSLVGGLAQRLRALIAGEPVELMPVPPLLPVAAEELAGYPGLYRGFGVSVQITRDGRGLLAQFNEPRPLRIHPVEPDVFIYRAVSAQLAFERDESGKVAYAVLEQNGLTTRMVKVEADDDG